ncbi:myosin-8-like isoform X1 [Camellia sinensis]|uniref:myosin-8-like isoform X1 n=1 Tax=Camellia sinensis TaxID=4442 RepID=UPI0010361B10|nr:myosin-8-like isoform X1 [Camellia sinensis]XP_028114635.1 myosin-8-like isoform X1 [Camellia sinensis]XP_028114636.1 myosin-8-like isoform X1 [Camellia sinensis]
MQRLEEKISDMESENQILRQQSLFNAPVKFVSEHPSTSVTKNLENGNHVNEENKSNELQTVTPTKKFGTESDSKFRRSLIERQHENVDALINCIMKEVGFSQGSPVAACICLDVITAVEVKYPTSHQHATWSLDDLPRTVACTMHQGSAVTSMDFHLSHHTLLLAMMVFD